MPYKPYFEVAEHSVTMASYTSSALSPPPPPNARLPADRRQSVTTSPKVTAALALGQFPLSTSNTSTDHMFEMIQAITEDPIPALPAHLFSTELCDFVHLMLRRDPAERPTADKLLQHPFLQLHQGCDDLVDMVHVAPATRPEVRAPARLRLAY